MQRGNTYLTSFVYQQSNQREERFFHSVRLLCVVQLKDKIKLI